MINQLLKVGLIYQIWRWCKPRLKFLVVAFSVIAMTWILHSEYMEYLDRADSEGYLGLSYFLKWAIIFAVIFSIYVREKLRLKFPNSKDKARPLSADNDVKEIINSDIDRFENIRHKKRLLSRGDKLINGK